MPDIALSSANSVVLASQHRLRITVYFTRWHETPDDRQPAARYPQFRIEFDGLDPESSARATCDVKGQFGLHGLLGPIIKMAIARQQHVELFDYGNGQANFPVLYRQYGWEWLGPVCS